MSEVKFGDLLQESNSFTEYAQSRDRGAFKKLKKLLSELYESCEDNDLAFQFLAFDASYKFCDLLFGQFFHAACRAEVKETLYLHSRAVTAYAAQEIMFKLKHEFDKFKSEQLSTESGS